VPRTAKAGPWTHAIEVVDLVARRHVDDELAAADLALVDAAVALLLEHAEQGLGLAAVRDDTEHVLESSGCPALLALALGARGGQRLDARLDDDPDRVAEAHADELGRGFGKCGREEAGPALLRQAREDARQARLEAEVEQPVGLVEDEHLERRCPDDRPAVARLEELLEPTRRADDNRRLLGEEALDVGSRRRLLGTDEQERRRQRRRRVVRG
jgi:hypothetical protein